MDVRDIEPRTVLWALAEISWEDPGGTPHRAPATLEDTSRSGACLRVKRPFTVGSRVTIRWSREQFCATARNCRSDGRDYLIGVLREAEKIRAQQIAPSTTKPMMESRSNNPASAESAAASTPVKKKPEPQPLPSPKRMSKLPSETMARSTQAPAPPQPSHLSSQDSSSERKVMQPKGFLSKLWRNEQDGAKPPVKVAPTEVPVNKNHAPAPASPAVPHPDLLSYEDIYRAAGILSPRSGYGIHKVVDMLNSERLRDLSQDAKRASVLMALDAAGTSVDDLLHDAVRRQDALNSYDAAQRRQLEEFEAQKAHENAEIEAEMERIKAHYAERIQRNQEQVAKEKETLHNWQVAMQYETHRIAEVLELCGKPPAATTSGPAPPAASSPATASTQEKAARAHGS